MDTSHPHQWVDVSQLSDGTPCVSVYNNATVTGVVLSAPPCGVTQQGKSWRAATMSECMLAVAYARHVISQYTEDHHEQYPAA